jgi:hypothetical protein
MTEKSLRERLQEADFKFPADTPDEIEQTELLVMFARALHGPDFTSDQMDAIEAQLLEAEARGESPLPTIRPRH